MIFHQVILERKTKLFLKHWGFLAYLQLMIPHPLHLHQWETSGTLWGPRRGERGFGAAPHAILINKQQEEEQISIVATTMQQYFAWALKLVETLETIQLFSC